MIGFRKVDEYIKDENNLNILGFLVERLGKIIYEQTNLALKSKFKFQISNALDSELLNQMQSVPNKNLKSGFYIIPEIKTFNAYKVLTFEDKPLFDFVYSKILDKRELVFYSNYQKGILFAKSIIQDICSVDKFVTDLVLLVSDIEDGVDTLKKPLAKFTYKNHYAKFVYIEECYKDCVILTLKPKKKRKKKKKRSETWKDLEN